MNLNFRRYAEICKVEPQDDGTIKVYGYASSGAEDSDGEVVTPDAMKAALPDYMKFGAVREMHQPIAAGTALEANVEDDGRTSFGAHVVDPIAVKKVTSGVYKGFSIGGKVKSRNPENSKEITGIRLIEVSLVDRPANPEAMITVYKSETDDEKPVDEPAKVEEPAPAAEPTAAENAAKVAAADKAAIEELAVMLNKRELSPAEFVDAVKSEIARRAAPPVEAPPKLAGEKLKKGMYDLGRFAEILQSLCYLAQGAQCEADWEGDSSPVPAALRDAVMQLARVFAEMSAEEVSEMLAQMNNLPGMVEVITANAKGGEVEKAGAKFSTKTKEALADMHKCMKDAHAALTDACDKAAGLGYDKKPDGDEDEQKDDVERATQPGDMLKAAVTQPVVAEPAGWTPDLVAKMQAEFDARLAQATAELTKRIKHLEDQPAPAKGPTRAVAIGKTEDGGSGDEAPGMKPILKADGTVDEPATLAKVIHKQGAQALWPRTNS